MDWTAHDDLVVEIHPADGLHISRLVTERPQTLKGIADTFTAAVFEAFGRGSGET